MNNKLQDGVWTALIQLRQIYQHKEVQTHKQEVF